MVRAKLRSAFAKCSMVVLCLLGTALVGNGYNSGGYCVVSCAEQFVGQSETHGPNRSPFIDECNRLVKAPLGSPWCASFVSMMHYQCAVANPMSAYSPNWFKTEDCIYIRKRFQNGPILQGDCAGIFFPEKKRIAHICLVSEDSRDNKWIRTIEGNSNDEGGREGTQVVRRRRLISKVERISRFHDNR